MNLTFFLYPPLISQFWMVSLKTAGKHTIFYSLNIFHFTEIPHQLNNMKRKKKTHWKSVITLGRLYVISYYRGWHASKWVHKHLWRRRKELRTGSLWYPQTYVVLMLQLSPTSFITAFVIISFLFFIYFMSWVVQEMSRFEFEGFSLIFLMCVYSLHLHRCLYAHMPVCICVSVHVEVQMCC